MTAAKCLIVEDEYLIRLTIAEALTDSGFEVLEAGSGAEALELLEQHPDIALLLTDIQLPGNLDGTRLAQMARERAPALPVIFATGRLPETVTTGAGSARDVFITKPFLPSEVCAVAERLTGR